MKGKNMAISEIYAVYDLASESFVQSIPCLNSKVARMTFEKLYKDKRFNIPMLYDYPNQFSVYKIATFDDNKGLYDNLEQNELFLNFGSLDDVETSSS